MSSFLQGQCRLVQPDYLHADVVMAVGRVRRALELMA
jgi:hypothetical protein